MKISNWKNRNLLEAHGALNILGNRYAPDVDSDLKIGRLLVIITELTVSIKTSKTKIPFRVLQDEFGNENITNLDSLPGMVKEFLKGKINVAYDEFDSQLVEEFEVPDKLILTRKDLPKDKTGDKGWENGSALGAIVAALGPLFDYGKE